MSTIKEKDGRYFREVEKKWEWGELELSNFLMEFTRYSRDKKGHLIRTARFINIKNEIAERDLTANQITSSAAFRNVCFSMGNFLWRGNNDDLISILEILYKRTEGLNENI